MKRIQRFGVIGIFLGAAVTAGTVIVAQSGRAVPSQGAVARRAPQSLVAKALAQGRVRVIVGLNVQTVPEGLLNAADRANQRARIQQAQSAVLGDLSAFNFGVVKRFRLVPAMALDADLAGLDVLNAHPSVAYIEEDRAAEATLAQSTVIVGATTATSAGYTGSGAAVAILDTGVDSAHSFFGGRVVSEACYSTTASGSTALCVDGSTAPGSAAPCIAISGCDHGTHVAGIAAGSGASFNGVAPGASIIAIQVFSRFDSGCSGAPPCVLSYTSDQIAGLERVYDLRMTYAISSANMSLGGGLFSTQAQCDSSNASRKAVIDTLRSVGIATVISSGNGSNANGLSAPGCISTAVSVGSTIDSGTVDAISSFSNSASFLNLLAPGQVITSSVPGGLFSNKSGTSMAAPHVAGAWAVLKAAAPSTSVIQVLDALTSTGTPILDPRNGVTTPRINVALAVNALIASLDPDGGSTPTPGTTTNPDIPSSVGLDEEVIALHGSAFEPRDSATTFSTDVATGRWVTGGPSYLYAQLPRIPNGADIVQVLFYVEDADGSVDFNGRLCRHWVDSSNGLNPASDCPVNITTSGTGSGFIWADMPPTLRYRFDVDGDAVVENVAYTLSGGWGTSTTGTIKLRQVRILYKRQISPTPAGATFSDVPVGSPFHRFVEALVDSGVTGGCGSGMYCPNSPVTRGQMAVFLSSALGLHWPAF